MKDFISGLFWWPVIIGYTIRDEVEARWKSLRSTK